MCWVAADEPTITIEWDATQPKKKGAIWLTYLMARTLYISENEASYELVPGLLKPTFREELHARETATQVYREMKEADDELDVEYFNDLTKVADAGLMAEYVWVYLHDEAWSDPGGLRLEEFHRWRASEIPKHKAETHGGALRVVLEDLKD